MTMEKQRYDYQGKNRNGNLSFEKLKKLKEKIITRSIKALVRLILQSFFLQRDLSINRSIG